MKTAETSNDEILMELKNSCGCNYYYNEIIISIIKNPCGQNGNLWVKTGILTINFAWLYAGQLQSYELLLFRSL